MTSGGYDAFRFRRGLCDGRARAVFQKNNGKRVSEVSRNVRRANRDSTTIVKLLLLYVILHYTITLRGLFFFLSVRVLKQ